MTLATPTATSQQAPSPLVSIQQPLAAEETPGGSVTLKSITAGTVAAAAGRLEALLLHSDASQPKVASTSVSTTTETEGEFVPPGYEMLKKSPLAISSLETSPESFANLPGKPLADTSGFFSARSMSTDGERCAPLPTPNRDAIMAVPDALSLAVCS